MDKLKKDSRKLGFLGEFIIRKSEEYLPPQRAGTPRGEKIGFPQKKMDTCLFVALTNQSLKQIAESMGKVLGFSYALLRKWNSEADFQKECDLIRKEFAGEIIGYLQREYEKAWKAHSEDTRKNTGIVNVENLMLGACYIHGSVLEELKRLAMRDFYKHYSDIVRKGVTDQNVIGGLIFCGIQDLIKYARGEKIMQNLSDIIANKQALAYSIQILSQKRNLSIEEQRFILTNLDSMNQLIDDLLTI